MWYIIGIVVFLILFMGLVLRIMYIQACKEVEAEMRLYTKYEGGIKEADRLINECLNQIESE